MKELPNIGLRIQEIRETRKITLEQLAEDTHLSVEQLTSIEANTIQPAVAQLVKIARMLGVRVGTFLDDTQEDSPAICCLDAAAKTVSLSTNDGSNRQHMDYHALSVSKMDRHMEPYHIVLEKKEGEEPQYSSHEGEEFIYLLEGSVEVMYGKDSYTLKKGDSIHFDSIVPHHIRAISEEPAQMVAVLYTPF